MPGQDSADSCTHGYDTLQQEDTEHNELRGKGSQGESRCKLLRVVPSGVTQVELKAPSNEL